MAIVFTVGHSNRSIEELIALLEAQDIDILVDVRTYPSSQYNPQFNRDPLSRDLNRAMIRYEWRGANLGGRNGKEGNVRYDETLDNIVKAAEDARIVLMCSEGAIEKCHRQYMLTPDLLVRGVTVEHILWDGTVKVQQPSMINLGLFDELPPAPAKFGLQPMWSH